MTEHEFLKLMQHVNWKLNDWFPRRELQIEQIIQAVHKPTSQTLYIHGNTSLGQSSLLAALFSHSFPSKRYAYLDCADCRTPQALFEEALRALSGGGGSITAVEGVVASDGGGYPLALQQGAYVYERCEDIKEFVIKLKELSEAEGVEEAVADVGSASSEGAIVRYLIFDHAENLLTMSPSPTILLTNLMGLPELSRKNLYVIFVSALRWDGFRPQTGSCIPQLLSFPAYTKVAFPLHEIIAILSEDCPAGEDAPFFQTFVELVYDAFSNYKDLDELRRLVSLLFPQWVQPVMEGQAKRTDTQRLCELTKQYFLDAKDQLNMRHHHLPSTDNGGFDQMISTSDDACAMSPVRGESSRLSMADPSGALQLTPPSTIRPKSRLRPDPSASQFTKRKNWSQRIIGELKDFLHVISPFGKFLYCSASCEDLVGYTAEELVDKNITDFLHEEDRDTFVRDFNTAIQQRKGFTLHYRFKIKGGGWIVLEVTGNPYFKDDAGGPCKAFYCMARSYPSRTTAQMDSFLGLKIENENLKRELRIMILEDGTGTLEGVECPPRGAALFGSGPVVFDKLQNLKDSNPLEMLTGLGTAPCGDTTVDPSKLTVAYGDMDSSNAGVLNVLRSARTNAPVQEPPTGTGVALGPGSSSSSSRSRKKKAKIEDEVHVCTDCGTMVSPEWRRGPLGQKTLCNACGLRWAKKSRRNKADGGGESVTSSGSAVA